MCLRSWVPSTQEYPAYLFAAASTGSSSPKQTSKNLSGGPQFRNPNLIYHRTFSVSERVWKELGLIEDILGIKLKLKLKLGADKDWGWAMAGGALPYWEGWRDLSRRRRGKSQTPRLKIMERKPLVKP